MLKFFILLIPFFISCEEKKEVPAVVDCDKKNAQESLEKIKKEPPSLIKSDSGCKIGEKPNVDDLVH
jgi:hypothetical protein